MWVIKLKGGIKEDDWFFFFWVIKSLFGFNGWLISLFFGLKYENIIIWLIFVFLFKSYLFLFEIYFKRSYVFEFLNRSFVFKWLFKY